MEQQIVFAYNGVMPMPPKIDFAQLCKQIRAETGRTQKEMAEILGPVNIRTYQRWEEGEVEPSAQAAFKLAQMFYEGKLAALKKKLAKDISKDIDAILPDAEDS